MNPYPSPAIRIGLLISAFLLLVSPVANAQKRDSTLFFRTSLSATQNGFSFIPSFSLGKPAVILEPSIGNKRMSFEPQFRFAMEGKPWSFIFIYRYKFRPDKRFRIQVGGHIPSLVFSTQSVLRNGITEDVLISNRFLAAELIPEYVVSPGVRAGMYLLRGHGFDKGSVRDSYFAGVRASFLKIRIAGRTHLRVTPQVYYLKTDNLDGYYVTNTLTLAVDGFPISISNIINKAIETEIPAKTFDWNISIVYSFDKTFVIDKKL